MSALVFAFCALLTAQEVDARASARVETTAGQIPTGTSTVTTVGVELSPSLAGIMTTHSVRMTLTYAPRIYYRSGGLDRPLILNRGTLLYQHALDSDLGLAVTITGSKGDLDFIAATGDTIVGGATPEDTIINITSFGGAVTLTKRFRASESLEVELRPNYTEPRTSSVASTKQIRAGGDVTYTYGFSAHDSIQMLAGGEVVRFDSGLGDPTSTPNVRASGRWNHTFGRNLSGHLLAGAGASVDPVVVLPLAELGLDADLYRRAGYRLSTSLNVGLDTFANPLLGSYDGRVVGSLGWTIELGQRITMLPNVSFYTTITSSDSETMPAIGVGNVTETVLQGRIPFSYEIDREVYLEVGVRSSARGPRLSDDNFGFGQLELVGYASFSASIDTRVPPFAE